jgi:adenylyltransferase/sulfurtransferase
MPAHDNSNYGSVEELAEALQSNDGEITVKALKSRWDAGEDLYVLDVRNPVEWEISALGGTIRIPKPEIEKAKLAVEQGRADLADTIIGEIPDDREVIVHCRSGVRSADVIEILKGLGYNNKLVNLKGGILAWADEIDNAMPTY